MRPTVRLKNGRIGEKRVPNIHAAFLLLLSASSHNAGARIYVEHSHTRADIVLRGTTDKSTIELSADRAEVGR